MSDWLNDLHETLIRGALAGDTTSGQPPVSISVLYPPRVGALTAEFPDGGTGTAQVLLPACVVTLIVDHVRPIFASDAHMLSAPTWHGNPTLSAANTQTPSQTVSMGAQPFTSLDSAAMQTVDHTGGGYGEPSFDAPSTAQSHGSGSGAELREDLRHPVYCGYQADESNGMSTYDSRAGGIADGVVYDVDPAASIAAAGTLRPVYDPLVMTPRNLDSSVTPATMSYGGADRVYDPVDYTAEGPSSNDAHWALEYHQSTVLSFQPDAMEEGEPSESKVPTFPYC